MQLYSALNLTPIERLEKEWKSLPKRVIHMYEQLKQMFESSGNFKQYRETLAHASAPAIPVLSFILSDLTMIEENKTSIKVNVGEDEVISRTSNEVSKIGEHTDKPETKSTDDVNGTHKSDEEKEESELVHFEKMSMIYHALSHLKRCSSAPYPRDGDSEKRQHDKKGSRTKEDLVKMLLDLPRLSEKDLYGLKNDTKKKVKELRKAFKAARKK